MKESASNLEFEEAAKIRDEIRKLEASELEISLNPKISQYNLKSNNKKMEAKKIIITGGATRIGAAISYSLL